MVQDIYVIVMKKFKNNKELYEWESTHNKMRIYKYYRPIRIDIMHRGDNEYRQFWFDITILLFDFGYAINWCISGELTKGVKYVSLFTAIIDPFSFTSLEYGLYGEIEHKHFWRWSKRIDNHRRIKKQRMALS